MEDATAATAAVSVASDQTQATSSDNMTGYNMYGGDIRKMAEGGASESVGGKNASGNGCLTTAENNSGLAEVVRKHSNPLASVVSPPLMGSKRVLDDECEELDWMNHARTEGCIEHIVRGQRFLLPKRYAIYRYLGNGSYGAVLWCHDTLNKRSVAVKKIRSAFRNTMDGKRTLREIKIGRSLQHENVVAVLDVFVPFEQAQLIEDVYIVFPLYDTE